jgi:hypothetical protein
MVSWLEDPAGVKHEIEELWREITPYLDELFDQEPEARQAWVEALERREPAIGAQIRICLIELAELDERGFLLDDAGSILARRPCLRLPHPHAPSRRRSDAEVIRERIVQHRRQHCSR